MTKRVSPKQRIRSQIDEAVAGSTSGSLTRSPTSVAFTPNLGRHPKLGCRTLTWEYLSQFLSNFPHLLSRKPSAKVSQGRSAESTTVGWLEYQPLSEGALFTSTRTF